MAGRRGRAPQKQEPHTINFGTAFWGPPQKNCVDGSYWGGDPKRIENKHDQSSNPGSPRSPVRSPVSNLFRRSRQGTKTFRRSTCLAFGDSARGPGIHRGPRDPPVTEPVTGLKRRGVRSSIAPKAPGGVDREDPAGFGGSVLKES